MDFLCLDLASPLTLKCSKQLCSDVLGYFLGAIFRFQFLVFAKTKKPQEILSLKFFLRFLVLLSAFVLGITDDEAGVALRESQWVLAVAIQQAAEKMR